MPNNCALEMYNHRHYFTVSGNVYGDSKPIADRTLEFASVFRKYFPDSPSASELKQSLPLGEASSVNTLPPAAYVRDIFSRCSPVVKVQK